MAGQIGGVSSGVATGEGDNEEGYTYWFQVWRRTVESDVGPLIDMLAP